MKFKKPEDFLEQKKRTLNESGNEHTVFEESQTGPQEEPHVSEFPVHPEQYSRFLNEEETNVETDEETNEETDSEDKNYTEQAKIIEKEVRSADDSEEYDEDEEDIEDSYDEDDTQDEE